jgi:hypothetical protein
VYRDESEFREKQDRLDLRNCELCGQRMTQLEKSKYGMCTKCLAEEAFQQSYEGDV